MLPYAISGPVSQLCQPSCPPQLKPLAPSLTYKPVSLRGGDGFYWPGPLMVHFHNKSNLT